MDNFNTNPFGTTPENNGTPEAEEQQPEVTENQTSEVFPDSSAPDETAAEQDSSGGENEKQPDGAYTQNNGSTPYQQYPPYGGYSASGPASGYSPYTQNNPAGNSGSYSPYNSQYGQPPVTPAPKKKNTGIKIFCVVLAAVILVIGSISVGYAVGNGKKSFSGYTSSSSSSTSSGSGSTSSFDITTDDGSNNRSLTYEQVIETVSDSIVSITVYSSTGSSAAYASGVIMDAEQGYVVTNDHIYESIPNAKFLITLRDGTEFKASFVSGDSRSDIGILKIDSPSNLKAATFSTQSTTAGEEVLAIGMSAGLSGTITQGIVSAVDRRMSSSNSSSSSSSAGYSEKFIQTTAAINPGNSGGALVNMSGEVVGITSSKYASTDIEGICFAIPTTRALNIISQLQQYGKVTGRSKLSITYTAVGAVQAEINSIPEGVYIQQINSDSDLAGKGYSQGDVITKVNGKAITSADVLLDAVEETTPGNSLTLTIWSASTKTESDVSVKLIEAESSTNYSTKEESSQTSPYNNLPFGDSSGSSSSSTNPFNW